MCIENNTYDELAREKCREYIREAESMRYASGPDKKKGLLNLLALVAHILHHGR